MTPRIVIRTGNVIGIRGFDADALYVDPRSRRLRRDGAVVEVSRYELLYVVALTARCGAILTGAELSDLLYGDRADGGPDNASQRVLQIAASAKVALAALGFHHAVQMNRGHSAHAVLRLPSHPHPVFSELEHSHG